MTNKRIKTSARNCDALDASINGAGILSIPHELLLAIARHLGPPIEFLDPMRDNFTGQPSFSMNSQRRQTLHSLSQCCRVLRSFFLPLAWEYFELPPGKRLRTSSRSMVALESKSRALARHPNLAAYVRVIYMEISARKVIPAYAKCLHSLPNLHTLQVTGLYGQLATAIKTAFTRRHFLKIRTIILPYNGHHIVGSCPNVENVTLIGSHGKHVFGAIAKRCKMVEVLDFGMPKNDTFDSVGAMPNLCSITIRLPFYHNDLTPERISVLSALPRLHTITICRDRVCQDNNPPGDDKEEAHRKLLLSAAANALKEHEGDENGRKWVKIWYRKIAREHGTIDLDRFWTKAIEVEVI